MIKRRIVLKRKPLIERSRHMITQNKETQGEIIAGIDTHKETYSIAVCNESGKIISNAQFSTTQKGINDLIKWLLAQGRVLVVGIEGTGTYGKNITQKLQSMQIRVFEVIHPMKNVRRTHGKSDDIDAKVAAKNAYDRYFGGINEKNACVAKDRSAATEEIRLVKASHDEAVKMRTQTINQLKAAVVGAPVDLRESLRSLSTTKLVQKCASFRLKGSSNVANTKLVLKHHAKRILALEEEIADYKAVLEDFATENLPNLMSAKQVGAVAAVSIFLSAGANVDRFKSEAAFAKHCGIAPVPVSSGKNSRMRLSRAGDRKANSVYYMIAIGRMGHDDKTKEYVKRRLTEGKHKKEIIRSLKRYIVRETFHLLRRDLNNFKIAS